MAMDQRKNNTWRFRIMTNGHSYTQNFEGTKTEAKRAHNLFKADLQRGLVGSNENMKFSELAQIVYDDYVKPNLKYQSQELYKNAYNNHLLKQFGNSSISKITTYHIQHFIKEKNTNFMPSTVRNYISVMSRTFDLAIKWGFIQNNPCHNLILPKRIAKSNGELASIEDIKKLFGIYAKETNKMHAVAFYLAIGCGMRNSEIRALTLDDIDFKDHIINIDKQVGRYRDENGVTIDGDITPKTPGSTRKVYAPDFVIDALKDYIKSLPLMPISKQIFYNIQTSRPVSTHCFSKRFRTIIMDNHLPKMRFHDLRHLQATLLVHSGVNISAVSKRLGHSSSRTTLDVYTHSMDSEDRKAVETLENYIKCINS